MSLPANTQGYRRTGPNYGVAVAVYPSTAVQYDVELQRRLGTTGTWQTLVVLPRTPQEYLVHEDRLPNDNLLRGYRARHVREGYGPGGWTSVVSARPTELGRGYDFTGTGSGSRAVTDGWSISQNASAPEGGCSLTNHGTYAYSNLEDAPSTATLMPFSLYFDVACSTGLSGTARLKFAANTGAASTSWSQIAASDLYTAGESFSDQEIQTSATVGTNYDLRAELEYSNGAGQNGKATFTMPGEADSPAGVNYTVPSAFAGDPADGYTGIGSYTAGDTIYATGTTALSVVGIGAAGTLYMSNGTAPTWATTLTGNYTWSGTQLFNGAITVASTFAVDTISEKTAATGVTIDGVLLKDSLIGWSYVDKTGSELNDIVDHKITVDDNWEAVIDEAFEIVTDLAA